MKFSFSRFAEGRWKLRATTADLLGWIARGLALAVAGWLLLAPGVADAGESGGGPADNATGSCDARESLGYCYDYVGERWEMDEARSECQGAPQGIFSTEGCPEDDKVGTCMDPSHGEEDHGILYHYYQSGFDESSARESCPGEFKPGDKR